MTDALALLSPDDVCEILGVRKSWLYDAVQAGEIPHVRLKKRLRFRRSDIESYIDARVRVGREPMNGSASADAAPVGLTLVEGVVAAGAQVRLGADAAARHERP